MTKQNFLISLDNDSNHMFQQQRDHAYILEYITCIITQDYSQPPPHFPLLHPPSTTASNHWYSKDEYKGYTLIHLKYCVIIEQCFIFYLCDACSGILHQIQDIIINIPDSICSIYQCLHKTHRPLLLQKLNMYFYTKTLSVKQCALCSELHKANLVNTRKCRRNSLIKMSHLIRVLNLSN